MKAEFKDKERQALEALMPLSKSDLNALFDYLDEFGTSCDHSLKDTTEFLKTRELDLNRIIPWLREHGGHCDCEVLANVEDRFMDILDRR